MIILRVVMQQTAIVFLLLAIESPFLMKHAAKQFPASQLLDAEEGTIQRLLFEEGQEGDRSTDDNEGVPPPDEAGDDDCIDSGGYMPPSCDEGEGHSIDT